MSVPRAAIVAEARRWVGTPWRHQGRVHGVGVDCGGLIIGVGQALGLLGYDVKPQYGRQPHWPELLAELRAHLEQRPHLDLLEGNVLTFAFAGEPQHLGICTGQGVIHAYAQVRACVEHRLDRVWLDRLRSVWSYRDVEPA
jgi:NlpC/P60 family putative phage cell wall peptidase